MNSTRTQTQNSPKSDLAPLWNVVLHDDDDHTYEYVIRMMQDVFGRSESEGFAIARRVDLDGRAVCLTTHLELAELKRDQALACGKDGAVARCRGPMTVTLEPCEPDA